MRKNVESSIFYSVKWLKYRKNASGQRLRAGQTWALVTLLWCAQAGALYLVILGAQVAMWVQSRPETGCMGCQNWALLVILNCFNNKK